MSYSIITLIQHKSTATPKEFQDHFETNEVPILKRIGGEDLPLAHTRIYLDRVEEGNHLANVVVGKDFDFPFDAVVLMEFEDKF